MALISEFVTKEPPNRPRLHDEIEGHYFFFETGEGDLILQIDTTGRASRDHPEKISQTIQLDEKRMRQLQTLIQRELASRPAP
jgi:hypothetical protein